MIDDEITYFRERAEAELEAADRATDQRAARVHCLLAGLYFDRAFNQPSAEPKVAATQMCEAN